MVALKLSTCPEDPSGQESINYGKGCKMAKSKVQSTTKARCQEGWRLFFRIGDLYTSNMNQPSYNRKWVEHRKAIEEHKNHIEDCDICNSGLKELQLTLEEMAVADGDGIS